MKQSLIVLFALAGMLSSGLVLLEETDAGTQPEIVEEWVNANLVRIRINGRWEEMPLMPLADHMCKSTNRLFKKYCGDSSVTP